MVKEKDWQLATWMKKKGYKMPAEEALPTDKEQKDFASYGKKIADRLKESKSTSKPLGPMRAEESTLTPHYKESKPKAPETKLSPKDEIESFLQLHEKKAEEEDRMPDKQFEKIRTKMDKDAGKWDVERQKRGIKKAEEEEKVDSKIRGTLSVMSPAGSGGKHVVTRHWTPSDGKRYAPWKDEELKAGEDSDMLVYPEEFKMGMKEEQEHSDVVGTDKEKIKKVVLAHLKEDNKYYSKLGTVMKAEEERRLSPVRRSMKGVPHEKDVIRHLQVIDPVKKKAEEEERKPSQYAFKPYTKQDIQKQGVVTGLVRSMKPTSRPQSVPLKAVPPTSDIRSPSKKTPAPATPKQMSPTTQKLRQQFVVGKPRMVSKTPIKHSDISTVDAPLEKPKPMEHKGEEEGVDTSSSKYTKLLKSDPKMTSPKVGGPRKMIDRVNYQKAEESGIKGITNLSPTLLDVKTDKKTPEKPLHEVVKTFWDEKADETSDYLKSLTTRKSLLNKPTGAPPKTETDLPSERLSASLLQKAEEELGEGKKAFNEDALNELYCFLRWMSEKGFKAEDGDKFEQYMNQYDVEQFGKKAEEEMREQSTSDKLSELQKPPQFTATPGEKKAEEELDPKSSLYKKVPKPTKELSPPAPGGQHGGTRAVVTNLPSAPAVKIN